VTLVGVAPEISPDRDLEPRRRRFVSDVRASRTVRQAIARQITASKLARALVLAEYVFPFLH